MVSAPGTSTTSAQSSPETSRSERLPKASRSGPAPRSVHRRSDTPLCTSWRPWQGSKLSTSTTKSRPDIAQAPLYCKAFDAEIPAGQVIGFTDVNEVTTRQGITLRLEMTGQQRLGGPRRTNSTDAQRQPSHALHHLRNAGEPHSAVACGGAGIPNDRRTSAAAVPGRLRQLTSDIAARRKTVTPTHRPVAPLPGGSTQNSSARRRPGLRRAQSRGGTRTECLYSTGSHQAQTAGRRSRRWQTDRSRRFLDRREATLLTGAPPFRHCHGYPTQADPPHFGRWRRDRRGRIARRLPKPAQGHQDDQSANGQETSHGL